MTEKGLRVRMHSAGPLRILADAALIHRVVSNLLDNELKHLPAGSTVSITLRPDSGDAVLLIEDDGPGFSKEIDERLFEKGVKGKGSRGHGLGLAFVQAVVRAHGGSVSAATRLQGGARLSIVLPMVVAEGDAEHLPALVADEG
jgi:signal transduction histidine kinase